MDIKDHIQITETYNAPRIYKQKYRKNVLQGGQARRSDGNIPTAASEDELERGISGGAAADINATEAQQRAKIAPYKTEQANLDINADCPLDAFNSFTQEAEQCYADRKAENENLMIEKKSIEDDISVKKTMDSILREPKPNHMKTVAQSAGLFGAAETLVTVVGLTSGGMPMAQAMILSGAVSVVNVGIGGAIMGGALLPYCLKVNAGRQRWFARLGELFLAIFVLVANLKVWEFRAKYGYDPLSPTAEADAQLANLIGLLMFGIGIFIAMYWLHSFAKARDLNLEYGRLGERLDNVKADLKYPAEDCRDSINTLSKELDDEFEAQRDDAVTAVNTSDSLVQNMQAEAAKFNNAQLGIVREYEHVTELARQDLRGILGADTPAYYGTAPVYSSLLLSPINTTDAETVLDLHRRDRDALIANERDAKIKQKDTVKDLFDRILAEFGS